MPLEEKKCYAIACRSSTATSILVSSSSPWRVSLLFPRSMIFPCEISTLTHRRKRTRTRKMVTRRHVCSSPTIAFRSRLDMSTTSGLRRNRSLDTNSTVSNYDNGSSSMFGDNDYEQDRFSLIELSNQRKAAKHPKPSDTIVQIWTAHSPESCLFLQVW